MKTYIKKTVHGYQIDIGKGIHKLTVSHIYKGVATCYLQESRPKYYKSKAAAERIARQIEAGAIKVK